jgi:dipeptidyl aminopeptidase/acylaminoacyl peptidase
VLLDVHATISKGDAHRQLTNYTHDYFGNRLESIDVDELWFKGADDKDVMTFVLKPPGFQSGQKHSYPMVFYIHGGPQSAWFDNWNVRWNKALFASQGYIVVGVNFAGSTSYGQSFTDSIREEWGGRGSCATIPLMIGAFKDLLTGYQAVLERYPEVRCGFNGADTEIDPERTAGVGPSFGGYMINWINGHNEEFKFKTLVCHAGVFDTSSFFYTTAVSIIAGPG